MSTTSNKDIVRRLIEAHIRFDKSTVAEILSPRLVWHMAGTPNSMTRDDYLKGLEMGNRAFSDLSHSVHDVIGDGDKVVTRTTLRLRHTGEFQGIPASNRTIEFESMWMYKVVDQKVTECWGFDENFVEKLK
jgi:predicted ester cyclase